MNFKTIEWKNNTVVMLDQRKLPTEEVYNTYSTSLEVAQAIKDMVIRGAPAIGVAGAMGLALGALEIKTENMDDFIRQLETKVEMLLKTRPTAINLQWGLERMKKIAYKCCHQSTIHDPRLSAGSLVESTIHELIQEAQKICIEDIQINRTMGQHGQKLLSDGDTILTHCNAGALATAGYGTALGVIYAAKEAGKKITVFADETRPFLQGSRLTAWELQKNAIPTTLITDNMAGWMMRQGKINKVIVGADRIAANGDVANKIGTYSVAILAKQHDIPFYVAAPLSTIDLKTKTGDDIPIEERDIMEVTHIKNNRLSPDGIQVKNPAFDVTPHELVAGIITEKGIVQEPYTQELKKLFKS